MIFFSVIDAPFYRYLQSKKPRFFAIFPIFVLSSVLNSFLSVSYFFSPVARILCSFLSVSLPFLYFLFSHVAPKARIFNSFLSVIKTYCSVARPKQSIILKFYCQNNSCETLFVSKLQHTPN